MKCAGDAAPHRRFSEAGCGCGEFHALKAAMDRSLLAMHNIHVTGRWWKGVGSHQGAGICFRARRTGNGQNGDGRQGARG